LGGILPNPGCRATRLFISVSSLGLVVAQLSYLWLALASLALFEPIAVAVHFEDVEWWVSRSSSAPVSRSDPNTPVHSSNGRLLVTMVEPRS